MFQLYMNCIALIELYKFLFQILPVEQQGQLQYKTAQINNTSLSSKHAKTNDESLHGKLATAQTSSSSDVQSLGGSGYSVKGLVKDSYTVGINEPQCSCYNWRSSLYPCKHIFYGSSPYSMTFEDLPQSYTHSPWLQLDRDVLGMVPKSK